jgi:E3 ubiquitin-protein ligase EDD1
VEPLAPASRQASVSSNIASRLDTESSDGGFLAQINSALRGDLDDTNDPDAMVQDDGDISEHDDSQSVIHSRQNLSNNNNNNNNNVVDEAADDPIGQDGGQEAESDNEFNFPEAETESDSDDNQSTQDAGRSVQTGATAGSDTGKLIHRSIHFVRENEGFCNVLGLSNFVLINEDDTGDSSQPDEDGSEDGDSDEQSTEEFVLDDNLERRSTSGQPRSTLPPHSLHWAIRSREQARTTNIHRLTGASSLVFIDPNAIRRSASANAVAAQESPTMATTSSSLARAFGIVLRQISELVAILAWKFSCPTSTNYQNCDVTYQEAVQLQVINYLNNSLKIFIK